MVPTIRVPFWVGSGPCRTVLQSAPLYAGVLCAEVYRLELRRVHHAEHIAHVVGAVDVICQFQADRVPGIDDGISGAGEEQLAIGGQKEAQDSAGVCLDAIDQLERRQGPHQNIPILCPSIYIPLPHRQSKYRAVVLQVVGEGWSGLELAHVRRIVVVGGSVLVGLFIADSSYSAVSKGGGKSGLRCAALGSRIGSHEAMNPRAWEILCLTRGKGLWSYGWSGARQRELLVAAGLRPKGLLKPPTLSSLTTSHGNIYHATTLRMNMRPW